MLRRWVALAGSGVLFGVFPLRLGFECATTVSVSRRQQRDRDSVL